VVILLVEQYYEFARSLADHYIVMMRGEVVQASAGRDLDAQGVRNLLAV
jgi:urea transport system ATP-binding protein